MKIDKARLPELEIIYLELKMKVSRSAAIESPVRKQQGVKKLKCKSWKISLRRRKLRVVFLPCEMNHALKKIGMLVMQLLYLYVLKSKINWINKLQECSSVEVCHLTLQETHIIIGLTNFLLQTKLMVMCPWLQ